MDNGIVAGIVVLYNPNVEETIENIKSYIDELDVLYCYDNSLEYHEQFDNLLKCKYIPLYDNKGLAYALTCGCERAIQEGGTILITFDQDTYFEKGCITEMVKYLKEEQDNMCLVSPNIKRFLRDDRGKRIVQSQAMYETKVKEEDWVITSGCAFTSKTYIKSGGFDEKLFIAQIDQDYSYAIKRLGGTVVRIGNVFMYQELGKTIPRKFLGKTVYPPNHPPIRYYYIFRNERYLRKKWKGGNYKKWYAPLYKYLITIILYEDNKIEKLRMIIRGYIEGKTL